MLAVQPPGADPTAFPVCSFNIQFFGPSRVSDDTVLARVVDCSDIVAVQELGAPPYKGTSPGGKAFKPDKEAAEYFAAMQTLGYA